MLNQAFAKIPDGTGSILHSDQGWQYQHKHYQKMLKDKGIRQSMLRKGNCLDNAFAENFFSLLKTELLYLQEFYSKVCLTFWGSIHVQGVLSFPKITLHKWKAYPSFFFSNAYFICRSIGKYYVFNDQ